MKNLFSKLTIALFFAITLIACNKDDFDYEGQQQALIESDKRLDSLFEAQSTLIEEYVEDNFSPNAKRDTVKYKFQYIDKTIERGIWYEILSEPTDNSYEYTGQIVSSYYGTYFAPNLPKVKLKYTAHLLNGTKVQEDATGTTYDLETLDSKKFNNAWQIAFVPYSIQYNGSPQKTYGLTKDGLKKGSKIRVITPSPWAFGTQANDNIPANSILIYEFEVLDIQ